MNAYLTRLGIRPEIQEWIAPWHYTGENGNLCFPYGSETEVYGLAFHKVPAVGLWTTNTAIARQIIICSSAMEAIAWLNCNLSAFQNIGQLMLAATGSKLCPAQFKTLPKSKYQLVFGNDLLGRICDLKAAAFLAGYPIDIWLAGDFIEIIFRNQPFCLPCETFSLSAFEHLSGHRFHIKTAKPRQHSSWLSQLSNHANY